MNLENWGGRGTTVTLLATIYIIHFIRSGGWGDLWGAATGEYLVK